MFIRRLWILFIAILLGFFALTLRLAKLQLADAQQWRDRMTSLVHRQDPIESYRGRIVDRNGVTLARDVPSDELAIDYRAMNLDDTWLARAAVERLKASKEWGNFPNRPARNRRLEETKANIADEIISLPDRLAVLLAPVENLPAGEIKNQIIDRISEIRQRVALLRQDIWLRRFDPRAAHAHATGESTSSTGENAADVDDSSLDALFQQLQLKDEVVSHRLIADLPAPAALYFKQHLVEFPGLIVRDNAQNNRRDYPLGPATAHVVGTLRSVSSEALKAHTFELPDLLKADDNGDLSGYLPGDRMGENGIERTAEAALHGIRGARLSALGDPGTQPADERRVEPIPGRDVQLTLDASLQLDLYRELQDPTKALLKGEDGREHPAAMVIMSMDGQLLAVLSYPSYDPNQLDLLRGKLLRDVARTPLINRATSAVYPPGSTAKPLLAAAALTERAITLDEVINCPGHLLPSRLDIFKCDAVHNELSLIPAIAKSCDVYFYTVGQRLGIARLTQWYSAYGFGHDTGMELPESDGMLPKPAEETDRQLDDARRLGIGQGPIAVTPLQMTNAYATLLRGGVAVPPRLLAETPAKQTQAFQISPPTLAAVRQGMERVVSEGTGRDAFRGMRLRIAGKTGTAENERPVFDDNGNPVDNPLRPLLNPDKTPQLKPDGTPAYKQLVERHDDAWFIGYAPADNPRFIVAAVMEWGGHGGAHAAPMVKEAFLQLQRHNYLPHTDVP